MSSGTLNLRTRGGYGVGMLGIAVVYQALGTLLIYYYTNVLHLPPAQAGLVVFVSTIWDGLADPLVAWAASRTRTRFGQYRPWLIFASIPTGLFFMLMFFKPDWPLGQLALYALVTSLVFRTLFQCVYLPYTALIGQLTGDGEERARLAGWKGWFTSLGQVLTSFFALTLVERFGHGDDRQGFLLTAALLGVIISATLFASGMLVREREVEAGDHAPDASEPLLALKHMAGNRPFRWLFFASICFGTAYAVFGNMTVYLFQYGLHSRVDARWALGALSAAGLLASPLWSMVAVRRGKRFVWLGGSLLASAAMLLLYLFNPQTVLVTSLFYGLIGLGLQPLIIIQFAALADAIDHGEWKTGVRVSSFSFGAMTLGQKTALAIGGGAAGGILALIGFSPAAPPSPHQMDQLRAAMMIGPAAIMALSALAITRYEVTKELHRSIRADLDARAAGTALWPA